ncbi:Membrane protein insertase YidC [Candidatus Magnetaquicoccaceae bacterium FCR-1]|uniref:Membrane protein insertase YidC n=1 Tax=Candidatus Magnetaquiglobus chichijimensis TaxID=3141448 RepID=A0ABQ0CCE9_9PROT
MDRRTLLAITLSFLLLIVFQTVSDLYLTPPQPAQTTEQQAKEVKQEPKESQSIEKSIQDQASVEAAKPPQAHTTTSQEKVIDPREQRFEFDNGVIVGQISNLGATLTQAKFLKNFDKLPPEGKPIEFLSPTGNHLFFEESGFLGEVGVDLPNRKSVWTRVGSGKIGPNAPLTLVWENGKGLKFEKIFTFQTNSYLITTSDRVINSSDKPVVLFHFAHFARIEPKPADQQAMAPVDFEGPMGYLDGTRVQHIYEDLKKQDQRINGQEGWVGFSDKYFLAAIVPEANSGTKKYYFDFDDPTHRVGSVAGKQELRAGGMLEKSTRLFIGPKEVRNLEALGLNLERSIDYGWFHFLAVPLVKILLFFNDFLHNYGVAIILLTVIIKILFFPLATKSYRSMNAMKKLAPKLEEIKKLYSHDKAMMQQETMRMYQENKVNPLGGCLPIVVQIPVFFALYKVLFLSVEMRQAPLFLWIQDLSIMDPYYVLPILMGISMFIQTKMNPAPADPVQAKVMLFLPVVFTFMFLSFPAGLVLYWLVNNVLSIAQQGYIMKLEK